MIVVRSLQRFVAFYAFNTFQFYFQYQPIRRHRTERKIYWPTLNERKNKIVVSWIFHQDGLMFNSIAIRTFTNNIQSILVVCVCANGNAKQISLNRIQFNSRGKSKYLKGVAEGKNQHPIRSNDKRSISIAIAGKRNATNQTAEKTDCSQLNFKWTLFLLY